MFSTLFYGFPLRYYGVPIGADLTAFLLVVADFYMNLAHVLYLTFTTLGGWFDQVLLAQRVVVMSKNGPVMGVIASKPPHLLPPAQREKVVKISFEGSMVK